MLLSKLRSTCERVVAFCGAGLAGTGAACLASALTWASALAGSATVGLASALGLASGAGLASALGLAPSAFTGSALVLAASLGVALGAGLAVGSALVAGVVSLLGGWVPSCSMVAPWAMRAARAALAWARAARNWSVLRSTCSLLCGCGFTGALGASNLVSGSSAGLGSLPSETMR